MKDNMKRLIAFLLTCIFIPAFAGPPVIWGPNQIGQSLTTKGLLVGQNWSTLDKDNYVKNADAFLGTTSVTASGTGATIAQNTSSPLGEVSDFAYNLGSTNAGYIEWDVRTLINGLTNAQCEASFDSLTLTVSGTATVTMQVLQNSGVIASQTVTPTATNQKYVLPFPCGSSTALSTTKLRIAQTAYTSGTTSGNIAGVYVGRSRGIYDAGNITAWTSYTPTLTGFGTIANSDFYWMRVGNSVYIQGRWDNGTVPASTQATVSLPNGITALNASANSHIGGRWIRNVSTGTALKMGSILYNNATTISFSIDDYTVAAAPLSAANSDAISGTGNTMALYAGPIPISGWTTTSAAITPNSQNVYGAAKFGSSNATASTTSATYATLNAASFGSPTLYGSAVAAGTSSCGTSNDIAICFPTLTPGTYRLSYQGDLFTSYVTSETLCAFRISDGTNSAGMAQVDAPITGSQDHASSVEGIFQYSTVQTNISFRLQAARIAGGGSCQAGADSGTTLLRTPSFILTRVDTANTQPVYIQGPVKAAQDAVALGTDKVGYQYRSFVPNSSAVSLVNGTAKTVTSITLAPGIYDISGIVLIAGSLTGTQSIASISTVTDSLPAAGTSAGDFRTQIPLVASSTSDIGLTIPQYRVTVSSTTTYYLIAYCSFSAGTASAYGRISAVLIN